VGFWMVDAVTVWPRTRISSVGHPMTLSSYS
jgi:hypothetical protein